jgi:hypothetical protein
VLLAAGRMSREGQVYQKQLFESRSSPTYIERRSHNNKAVLGHAHEADVHFNQSI